MTTDTGTPEFVVGRAVLGPTSAPEAPRLAQPARIIPTAWVIERASCGRGAEPLYYAAIAGRFKWTADLYTALRFARREDAEAMRRTLSATILEDDDVAVKEKAFL